MNGEANVNHHSKVLTQLDQRYSNLWLDRHYDEITHQQGTVLAEILDSISKQLHEIINKWQDELIGQLNCITKRKLKTFATQRDQIETDMQLLRVSLKTGFQQCEVLSP